MPRRDYFSEIEARRSRLKKRGTRWAQGTSRLDSLIDIVKFIEGTTNKDLPFREELAKYISIGFIACVEGYFRLAIRDIIDSGHPFQDNVKKLKSVRIDINHVVEIHKRRATLGEFVAHAIPLSNLEDINEALTTLLGIDFLEALKSIPVPLSGSPKSLDEMGVASRMVTDIKYSFEQRHLFAHELAPRFKIDIPSISMASRAVFVFVYAADTLIDVQLRHHQRRHDGTP